MKWSWTPGRLCTVIVVVSLAAWEVAGRSSTSLNFHVATPSSVATELARMVRDGTFLADFAVTGFEAASGLAIGMTVGTGVGLCLWFSEWVARAVRPIVLVLSAVPIIALGPLMIVWFGVGIPMKIAMASLTTVFIAFTQSYRGAQIVSAELSEIVTGLGPPRRRVLTKIVVPGALDWVLNGMRLNVGMALLGAFIGEFVAANQGLGYRLLRTAGLYNVPASFACAVGIIVLGVSFDALASLLERRRHDLVQLLCVPRRLRGRAHRKEA